MKKTPENLVKKEIKDYLDVTGWFHFPISQGLRSHKGISDRIAIKNGTVLFIEVKAPGGLLSADQKEFRKKIEINGGIYIEARGYKDIERYLYGLKHWLKHMMVKT